MRRFFFVGEFGEFKSPPEEFGVCRAPDVVVLFYKLERLAERHLFALANR